MTEKEMVAQIGQALGKMFKPSDMLVQGGTVNKKTSSSQAYKLTSLFFFYGWVGPKVTSKS